MKDHSLIQNDSEQNKLIDLFLLKAITSWLEKQNWISSPYGGDNYLEDIIFRIKLLSGQEWKAVFQDGQVPYDSALIKEYFEMLKMIDPSIKHFYDETINNFSAPADQPKLK